MTLERDEPVEEQRADEEEGEHRAGQQQLLASLYAAGVQAHEIQRGVLAVCLQQHVVKYAQGVKGDREHDDRRCQQDEQQRQGQLHPDAAADHQPERAEEEQEGK